jgi:hypothetical protein
VVGQQTLDLYAVVRIHDPQPEEKIELDLGYSQVGFLHGDLRRMNLYETA